MGLRPTNSDENHVGRASTPAAGLQTRLFPKQVALGFRLCAGSPEPALRTAPIPAPPPPTSGPVRPLLPTIVSGQPRRPEYGCDVPPIHLPHVLSSMDIPKGVC